MSNMISKKDIERLVSSEKNPKRIRKLIYDYFKASKTVNEFYKGKIIGYCIIRYRALIIPMATWFVHEKYRKKGIASKLFRELVRKRMITFCKIQPKNIASLNFAYRMGFKKLFQLKNNVFRSYRGTYMVFIQSIK